MKSSTTITADETTTGARHEAAGRRGLNLDRLARMPVEELTRLYREGTIPTMDRLDGLPACRMLSVIKLDHGRAASGLRRLAAWGRFPWAGKTFRSTGQSDGTGINRIRVPLLGQRTWYPFRTRVEPSAIDGQPCILLDYDDPQNPKPIRMVRDELREVAPGLFLGPAMIDTGGAGAPHLVLYFAVDNGAPSAR